MPGKLTHQQGQMLLHSFSDKSAGSPYHAAACRSKPLQAALASCTVPIHLEDTLMGEDARGAHETTILAPRRTLSDVLKERTNDSLSLSRSSSSNSENELQGAAASKEKGNDTESIPRSTDTEAKEEQSNASRMMGSNRMKALENLALPQLHAAVKMALEIRRRRGLEAASKAEQPRQELPDDNCDTSSPTAKQAAQTLTSMMASRGTDAVRGERQDDVSVADDGNKDGSSNNTDLPGMQASRKRKHDFQPSPSRLRRMSSLATEMSRNSIEGNPISAVSVAASSNPTPETTQQQEHQAPDMRRTAIVNSAAIRVFKAARQARMRSSASFCDDATSVPRPSVMPMATQPPQQEPTRRQADINRVWEAAVRVFLASHAQQHQQGAQVNSIDCSSMQNNAPRSSDPAWTDAMKVEHRHLFKAIAESRRHNRAGCL